MKKKILLSVLLLNLSLSNFAFANVNGYPLNMPPQRFQKYNNTNGLNYRSRNRGTITGYTPSIMNNNLRASSVPYAAGYNNSMFSGLRNFFNTRYKRSNYQNTGIPNNLNNQYTTIFDNNSIPNTNYNNFNNYYNSTPSTNTGVKVHIID